MYAHLSSATVRPVQQMRKGQQIGVSGNTGNTSGPHLHYEERVRPYAYADHRPPQLDLQLARSVNLDKVVQAFMKDPQRPRGRGLHPRMVRTVEQALAVEGGLVRRRAAEGRLFATGAYRCGDHARSVSRPR